MVTQEELKDRLRYEPETGDFIAIKKTSKKTIVGSVAGCENNYGYIQIYINYKPYRAHQLAFLYMTGEVPPEIDHINRIRSDNRWINIRSVTREQNTQNRTLSKNNSSGYNGVSFLKDRGKWQAMICIKGRQKSVGNFKTMKEAIRARKLAEKQYWDPVPRTAKH